MKQVLCCFKVRNGVEPASSELLQKVCDTRPKWVGTFRQANRSERHTTSHKSISKAMAPATALVVD